MELKELNLSTYTYNALRRNGILTIENLISLTENQVKMLKWINKSKCEEIKNQLKINGYSLSDNEIEMITVLLKNNNKLEKRIKKLEKEKQKYIYGY